MQGSGPAVGGLYDRRPERVGEQSLGFREMAGAGRGPLAGAEDLVER